MRWSELLPLQQLAQTLRERALQVSAVCLAASSCITKHAHVCTHASSLAPLATNYPSPHSHTYQRHDRICLHAPAQPRTLARTAPRRHHAGIRTHTFAGHCPCPTPTPVSPQLALAWPSPSIPIPSLSLVPHCAARTLSCVGHRAASAIALLPCCGAADRAAGHAP